MANMNFSANGIDNVKPHEFIRFFDSLNDKSKQAQLIKKLKYSDDYLLNDLSNFFEKRIKKIPPYLPDKNILTTDVVNIGKLELFDYIDNLRLLVALRYHTS
jgi:hypothetical protein